MSFIIYDLVLLVFFCLAAGIFLYKRRNNLKKEGIMYLYRTQIGIKFIDWFSKKHKRWLKPLQYLIIAVGYILMISVLWLIIQSVYLYVKYPVISQIIKAPPIFPIFPYFNKFFGLNSFFPDLFFTYFIVSIAVLAVFHEFAHGIIARLNKVRIKSTGFGFLGPLLADLVIAKISKNKKSFNGYLITVGIIVFIALLAKSWVVLLLILVPFLGAFVEQDDKDMDKAPKTGQLAILAAGVFTNILIAGLFLGAFWIFFLTAFQPIGVTFSDYASTQINISEIISVNGIEIVDINNILTGGKYITNETFVEVKTSNLTYFTTPYVLEQTLLQKLPYLGVYENTPAFNARLRGAIIEIDGIRIISREALSAAIASHKPGESMKIKTIYNKSVETFDVNLSERGGKAFLGISSNNIGKRGIIGSLSLLTPKLNDYNTGIVYASEIGDAGVFIFNFLWWLVILNALVAVFNMLPLGPFDGSRFFLITIWCITGNKKAGERAFKWISWFILLLLGILMVKWINGMI